jgi:hypothetical protein
MPKLTPEEKQARGAARARRAKRIVAIFGILIGVIGAVGLKIGISELWREYRLHNGALNAVATVLRWENVHGKYSTSCSVSYQFTTRNGEVFRSHNDIGFDLFQRDGFSSFPCSATYGSKSIQILYSETDPHVNRALEQPAVKHGILFCGIGAFLLGIACWQIWRRPIRSTT